MRKILILALLLIAHRLEAQTWTTLTVNPSSYTTGSVAKAKYSYYNFSRSAGYRYAVCVNTTTSIGDADLYVSTSSTVSKASYSAKSESLGTEDDCVVLNSSSSGTYYAAVFGFKATAFRIYVTGHKVANVPSFMKKKLLCPLDDGFRPSLCGNLTTSKYGPFGSPWGNSQDGPFFTGYQNYFHNGVDYFAPAGQAVFAAYAGTVVRVGSLGKASDGNSWGRFVVIEHSIDKNKFTTAYLHLAEGLLVSEQGKVARGQKIGTIADIEVGGEVDHIHFTIHTGSYRSTAPKSQGGAIPYNQWKDFGIVFVNPDIITNPDLYESVGLPR